MKKKELHNFYNHTILYYDDMCPSVVAAADSEGVYSMYTHTHTHTYIIYLYILATRHLNTNDPRATSSSPCRCPCPIDWKFNIGNYFFSFLCPQKPKTTFRIKQLGKFDFCTLFTTTTFCIILLYIRTPAIIQ